MKPPQRHRYIVTPKAQTSKAGVISPQVQSQGPAKGNVLPGRLWSYCLPSLPRKECASPKSMILRSSLRQSIKLPGLKSQWTIPLPCRKNNPLAACSNSMTIWYIETVCFFRQCCRERFYSHTVSRQDQFLLGSMKKVGMLGCVLPSPPKMEITCNSRRIFDQRSEFLSIFLARRYQQGVWAACGCFLRCQESMTVNLVNWEKTIPLPPTSSRRHSASLMSWIQSRIRKSNLQSCFETREFRSTLSQDYLANFITEGILGGGACPIADITPQGPGQIYRTISVISCLFRLCSTTSSFLPYLCLSFQFCQQLLREASLNMPQASSILLPATLANYGRSSCLSVSLQGEQYSNMKRFLMSSSMMYITLKVKLTMLRLNLASARLPSTNELCSSAISPTDIFNVNFKGDSPTFKFAAALALMIICSLLSKRRIIPFLRQLPRMLSRFNAGLKETSQ